MVKKNRTKKEAKDRLLGSVHLLAAPSFKLAHLASQSPKLPLRQSNASLFVDGSHERRQHLVDVSHCNITSAIVRP